MHHHTVLYTCSVFDPVFLQIGGDKVCGGLSSPNFSDVAPDKLATKLQSVK